MLFILTSIYYFLFLRVLWRVGDEGTLVYGAQRVVEGDLPYRDFFEVMGPASFYWLGLFFKIFGVHVAVARGLLLVSGTAQVLLIYWMTRRVYRGPFELLPALFYMIVAIPMWPATNHHWDSNLFALLALWGFVLWQDKRGSFYLVLVGMLAGFVSCFIQHKGLLVLLGLLLALLLNNRQVEEGFQRLIVHLGLVVAGYVIVGGLVIFSFFMAGGLSDLIYANLIWPMTNYHQVNIVPYGYGLMELLYQLDWKPLLQALLPPWGVAPFGMALMGPFFIILTLPVLLVVLTAASFLLSSSRPVFGERLWPYWIVGLALWLSEIHRMDIMHLVYGSPVLLILLPVVWTACCRCHKVLQKLGLGLITFAVIFYGAVHSLKPLSAGHKVETRRGTLWAFKSDGALAFLQEKTQPGEEVFVYPYYPMYYFYANVKNPTRYSILMYNINTRSQFDEVINVLEQKKVKYVLWDTFVAGDNLQLFFPKYRHPPEKYLKLECYLKEHYQILGIRNGFRIMVRQDLLSLIGNNR